MSEKQCTRCKLTIEGRSVTLQGLHHHPECFVCFKCRTMMRGKPCHIYDGQIYDPDCFAACCAEKCGICHKPIVGDNKKFFRVEDKTYHMECYKCKVCHQSLEKVKYVPAENDTKVCFPCYEKERLENAEKCDVCLKPIGEQNVEFYRVGNKKFHNQCFICKVCNRSLEGAQYVTAENFQRVCVPCNENTKFVQAKMGI